MAFTTKKAIGVRLLPEIPVFAGKYKDRVKLVLRVYARRSFATSWMANDRE